MRPGSPVPQAVLDRAKRLSEVHPQYLVAEMVGVCAFTLRRAKHRGWVAGRQSRYGPRPSDFEIMVKRGHTLAELATYYRASYTAIQRWKREIGLVPRRESA